MQSAPTLQEIQRLPEHGRGRTGVRGLEIGLGARTTPEAATESSLPECLSPEAETRRVPERQEANSR